MHGTRRVLHNGVKKDRRSGRDHPLVVRSVYSANMLWREDLRLEKYVFRLHPDNSAATRCGLDLRR
jgi:hypothetical protein